MAAWARPGEEEAGLGFEPTSDVQPVWSPGTVVSPLELHSHLKDSRFGECGLGALPEPREDTASGERRRQCHLLPSHRHSSFLCSTGFSLSTYCMLGPVEMVEIQDMELYKVVF